MDIDFAPEDEAFRAEVRSFIEENYPKHLVGADRGDLSKEDFLAWHKILAEKGWVAPSWPEEFGGTGWTVTQKYIWNEESAAFGTIPPLPFGVAMLGPVIYSFGNQEQKDWVLPGILSGETWWCQGYSEPGAGSDLAGLKTKAELDGDEYVVNGHKIWTTLAQHADWMFCLVRTSSDGKPQEGISFLLIDMKTPGIEVKPIYSIDGDHHLNEVYFTDVRVPVANLVGNENEGWTYAKYLLGHERAGIAGTDIIVNGLANLKTVHDYLSETAGDSYQADAFAKRHAELSVRYESLQMLENRALFAEEGSGDSLILPLPMKTLGTELQQDMGDLAYDMLGADSTVLFSADFEPTVGDNEPNYRATAPHMTHSMLFNRASTIFGGTTEVQKGIMSKFVLGL
ncbi:MAG: acyl-CoA dehydrogenase family protein [Parvibaculales bacterium]